MRFVKLAATTAALAAAAVLAACGGSGSGSHAQLRLINATASYASLDMTVNGTSIDTGVAFGAAGNYGSVDITAASTQIIYAGTTVAYANPALVGDNSYDLIAYGTPGNIHYVTIDENQTAPASGSASVNLVNLAPDAGALDFYLLPANTACTADNLANASAASPVGGVAGGNGSGYISVTAGNYAVCVLATGSKSDLRLSIATIALNSASVNTIMATGTVGGVLVNGIGLVQGGSLTTYATNTARLRVIGSLSGATTPTVAATFAGTPIAVTTPTPSIGDYVTVAAANSAVQVTVSPDGGATPVALPAVSANLTVGTDYTLLVWGSVSAPQTVLITDDNRLPTTAGTAKIRVINGVTNPNASMSLIVDLAPTITNVAPGTASTFATIPSTISGGTGSQLVVESPAYPGANGVYTSPTTNIGNLGLYNVYVLNNPNLTSNNGIQVTVRKDR